MRVGPAFRRAGAKLLSDFGDAASANHPGHQHSVSVPPLLTIVWCTVAAVPNGAKFLLNSAIYSEVR